MDMIQTSRRLIVMCMLLMITAHTSNSQSISHLDSLENSFSKSDPNTFINSVIDIPYDVAVKDINAFLRLTDKAIESSQKINNESLLAKSYIQKTIALHFTTKDEEALNITLKAISIFEKLKDHQNAAKAYLTLGWKIKYRKLNDAFKYMQKGVLQLEKIGLKNELSAAYNNFGVLYLMKSIPDSALYFHRKSLSITKEFKDSIGIPFAHTHIANVLLKQKEFTKAKKHLDTALFIRNKRNDTYGITDSYLYLGDLFFEKKEYLNAILNYKLGYNYASKYSYFPLKKYASEYLYKSFDNSGDYKNALKHLKIFQSLKDSVLNIQTNEKVEELQIEFETAKKEKEIISQQLKIKQKNLTAVILIGSIGLLLVIFWGIYRRNKLRRQQLQKELQLNDTLAKIKTQNKLQEQRLEISRDLHDNIGSQLTFIISSIDNLKYISKDINEQLKNKLANISSFTFDTIHQLRDTIWAMNKNQITFDEFSNRLLSYIEKAKSVKPEIQFEFDSSLSSDVVFTSVIGMNLFRVIQEGINNAIKHSEGNKITISVGQEENQVIVSVKDNGKGFDKENFEAGNGLSNIENRITAIQGSVSIDTEVEKGTIIIIKIKV